MGLHLTRRYRLLFWAFGSLDQFGLLKQRVIDSHVINDIISNDRGANGGQAIVLVKRRIIIALVLKCLECKLNASDFETGEYGRVLGLNLCNWSMLGIKNLDSYLKAVTAKKLK